MAPLPNGNLLIARFEKGFEGILQVDPAILPTSKPAPIWRTPLPDLGTGLKINVAKDMTVDHEGLYAYVLDQEVNKDRVMRVDLVTGNRRRVWLEGALNTVFLSRPTAIALDASGARLFVADYNRIIEITLDGDNAGTATVFSENTAGVDDYVDITDILVDPLNNRLVVADRGIAMTTSGNGDPRIFAVNMETGVRTVLVASDGSLRQPEGLAWGPGETTYNTVFVLEASGQLVTANITPGSSGTLTLRSSTKSGEPLGAGPKFDWSEEIFTVGENLVALRLGTEMLDESTSPYRLGALLQLDPSAGDPTVLDRTEKFTDASDGGAPLTVRGFNPASRFDTGFGEGIKQISAAAGPRPGTVLVASALLDAVLLIDIETGDRTIISH